MNYYGYLKTVLFTLSLFLLIVLLYRHTSHIDIAGSKNDHLTYMLKSEIDAASNIDTVKLQAKHWLDVIRQNTKDNSKESISIIWIIIALIFLQIVLWIITAKTTQLIKRGTKA